MTKDIRIPFPLGGIHEGAAFSTQPPSTTSDAQNVTGMDPVSGRTRGGQRAGMSKFNSKVIGSKKLALVSSISYDSSPAAIAGLASGSETTKWTKTLPGKGSVWCMVTDSANNVYVVDSGSTIVKYNPTGYQLYTFKIPVKDEGHEVRSIAIDADASILYVGVTTGGAQSTAHIFALEEIDGTSGQYLNKIWEYKTEAYVEKLIYGSGKLYAALSDRSLGVASILVLSGVGTAVPFLEKSLPATYPIGDIAVSPKDGSIISSSPINTQRGGDRILGTAFKSPSSVDWDPTKLEGYENRIWSWYDASDIDGDGSNNAAYSDGEEILSWQDKSGNGRSLDVPATGGITGPLLSKAGFNGKDCLAWTNINSSGTPVNTQFLESGSNPAITGDSSANALNDQNQGLIPTWANASYAMFMVVEPVDDGINQRCILSQRYINWTGAAVGSGTSGAMAWMASTRPSGAAIASTSITSNYTKNSVCLVGLGHTAPSTYAGIGTSVSSPTVDAMPGISPGYSEDGATAFNVGQIHGGSSNSNKFVLTSIIRTGTAAATPEPLFGGADAVASAGYTTTKASHFRVNGLTKGTFTWSSGTISEPARVGGFFASSSYPTGVFTGALKPGFRGRICEIIVLKEWYYRADETSQPVRLNVCSTRSPGYTTADHGSYSGSNYTAQIDATANPNEAAVGANRIYEAELIEGYLAHKWGIANELPNQLVGHIVMNASAVPTNNSTQLIVPNSTGTTTTYTFRSATGLSGNDIAIISGTATDNARIIAQANEIVKVLNGDAGQIAANVAPTEIYALPPTFVLDYAAASAAQKYAVIEVRTRSSMAHNRASAGFAGAFSSAGTGSGIFTFPVQYDSAGTNAVSQPVILRPRTKMATGAANHYGINVSVHPFAEHRRQVHQSIQAQAGWSIIDYTAARTLGGPPRADGKRNFQPLQVLSSGTQNLVKYDKDSGSIRWARFNATPEGVATGSAYVNVGGIGFGIAPNSDGVIFTSGQRATAASYPTYTEQTRLGLNYPNDQYDFRAITDNGASYTGLWQAVSTAATGAGLDSPPGWSRPVVDAYGNFVCPLFDQETTTASFTVYKASDGTEINEYTKASDGYPLGLSAAASGKTLALPAAFTNPRSEFVYLGSRVDNIATVTFSAQPAASSTITITDGPDSRTYTFVASATSANQVQIGGTLAITIQNFAGAINKSSGTYGAGTTVNASVAARTYDATTVLLAAKNPEPSGGTGVFTFAGSASPACNATMSAVSYKDATLRRIDLLSASPTGTVGSYRATKNVAVDGMGLLYTFDSANTFGAIGGSTFSAATAQFYDSTVLFQKMYITNGFEVLVYDPVAGTATALESKASGSPTERWSLVSAWRGRLVLARGLTTPHNWAMSAIGDPTNWDFFPPVVNPGQAIAGTISRAGLVPDVINAVIPYNDDLLLFGGDRSIFRMTGDPMAGGQMDLITDVTGIAFGRAWDKDPQGNLYFLSSRGALFVMPPGRQIRELSVGKFEQRLATINFSKSYTQLIWNDVDRTLHLMTFPLGQQVGQPSLGYTMRHFRYERDSQAFWEDTYGKTPTCAAISDSDNPNDRVLMIGCLDNYVRKWDNSALDDDGAAIDSYVTFGPFGSQDMELRMTMFKAVLSDNQSGVHVQLFSSSNPDSMGDPVWAGRLDSGSNPNIFTRIRGSYFWIRMRNSSVGERWAFESLVARMTEAGRKRL